MARARQIAGAPVTERVLALVAALAALPACDIVQGFKNAGDALFPPVKTYLDVPGFRFVSGSYRDLDIMTSSEPYVFARSANDDDTSLYVMRYQAPHPCRIPDVTGYWSNGDEHSDLTYIAYYDGTGSSTVHFSDTSCTHYDLELENAYLPEGYTTSGLVIHAGSELYLVNPRAGTTKLLTGGVQDIDASRRLVRANGQLGAFDREYTPIGWVGNGVKRALPAFGAIYYEDDDGIHRLTITGGDVPSLKTATVDRDGCHLAVLPSSSELQLLAFHSPCDEQRLVVWDASTKATIPIELPADPRRLRLVEQHATRGGVTVHPNLATDPYWAFYLADIDTDTDTGTLHVKLPDGTDYVLGDGAAFERTELAPTLEGDATSGFALLDAQTGTGRFVRWDASGEVTDIVSGVIRDQVTPLWTRLVIEVDASRADLAEVVNGEAVVVAHDVPRQRYAFAATHPVAEFAGKMAWLQDVQGTEGTLSIAERDTSSPVLDDQYLSQIYRSSPVAHGVHLARNGFMNDLPGLVYFTHFDLATRTGTLEYSNAELGFSAIVSEGAADYVQPGSGLLYSVPFGEGAGIWLARAK